MSTPFNIPFYKHDFSDLEISTIIDTLKSGWVHTGPNVKKFENIIKDYCESSHALALNSATAGLFLALKVFGIGPGDEVITTPTTFTATAATILHTGATVVFADIGDDLNIDPEKIKSKLTSRTKAVIPVDIGGYPCGYKEIFSVVKEAPFVEATEFQKALGRPLVLCDAAHSMGAYYYGVPSGSYADLSVFSFHVVKNITTGDGGMVLSGFPDSFPTQEFFQSMRTMSLHGLDRDAYAREKGGGWKYNVVAPGFKFNMVDMDASLGLAQFERFPEFLNRRKSIIDRYTNNFRNSPISIRIESDVNRQSAYHLMQVMVPEKGEEYRDNLIRSMDDVGVKCNVHFIPLPFFDCYKKIGFNIDDYPISKRNFFRSISLPLYTTLTNNEVDYISEKLLSFTH